MFRDAVEAIVDSDVELASQVSDRTSEADKHFALIERQFRRSLSDLQEADRLGCSRVELFGYYRAATHLDRIAGCATSMAEHVDQFQTPLPATFSRAFQEHASETKHLQERACNTVFRTSESAESHAIVRDCTRQRKAIDVERERLFDHEDSSVASSVNSLFDYLDRTVKRAGDRRGRSPDHDRRRTLIGRPVTLETPADRSERGFSRVDDRYDQSRSPIRDRECNDDHRL